MYLRTATQRFQDVARRPHGGHHQGPGALVVKLKSTLVTLDHLECQDVYWDGPKCTGGQQSAQPCSWHLVVPPQAHLWTSMACVDVVVVSEHSVDGSTVLIKSV